LDNLLPAVLNTMHVHRIMSDHFGASDQRGMLRYFYSDFKKDFVAGMCRELADCARDTRDPLCCLAFHSAGRYLALHILALLPKADKALFSADAGLKVVCTGSVWKSWDLLKEGFIEGLGSLSPDAIEINKLTLLSLNKPAAFGAVYLGARKAGHSLPVDLSQNATVFFQHTF